MSKDDTLLDNFVTVTKRLPLKARFLVGVCMVVVVFELISGMVELNGDNYSTGRLRNSRPHEVGKIRERKEVNPEAMLDRHHGDEGNNDLEKFDNSLIAQTDAKINDQNIVEVKDNVRLKYQKVQHVNKIDKKERNLTAHANNTETRPQAKFLL